MGADEVLMPARFLPPPPPFDLFGFFPVFVLKNVCVCVCGVYFIFGWLSVLCLSFYFISVSWSFVCLFIAEV